MGIKRYLNFGTLLEPLRITNGNKSNASACLGNCIEVDYARDITMDVEKEFK